MPSKRNSARAVSFAQVVARVVVAPCLALSLFASLVPLRASADAGAMACCVGKAGHCNTGLLAKRQARPKPKPEPLCGLKPAAGADEARAIAVDEIAGGDADEIPAEAVNNGMTILADSSAVTGPRGAESQVATEASPRAGTTSVQAASLAQPCPADCRAGTTGVVRQPRPREIALLAHGSRGSLPGQVNWQPRSPDTNLAVSATLKRTRPRGPPLSA